MGIKSFQDMMGKRYGHLTVNKISDEKYTNNNKSITLLDCKCDCGNIVAVRPSYLKSGHTKTCGHCNTYVDCGDYMKCFVKNKNYFIFDKEDYSLIKNFCWHLDNYGYAKANKCGKEIRLHRMLMGNTKLKVDHINNNPMDNRKSNLRLVTQHQNTYNHKLNKNSTTGYKGVCIDKKKKRYMAHIHPNGKMLFLGYYNNPVEAAKAYDKAAILLFGEFAKTNFDRRCYG